LNEQKKIILVVDDEDATRQLITQFLEAENYAVLAAESGNAALAICSNTKIDLILSDIQMEDGDGLFLLLELQKYSKVICPFIFVTGHSEISSNAAKKLGALALLRKPFSIDDLLTHVRAAIGNSD